MDSEDDIVRIHPGLQDAETKAEVEAAGDAVSGTSEELPADESSNSTEDSVNEMFSDAREIADRLEVIMPAVLDSAEATNNTADVTARNNSASTQNMRARV